MSHFPLGVSSEARSRYESSVTGISSAEFSLGANTSRIYFEDPKLLLFTLSRYKFVAKMLSGCGDVLEVGCQEGFGSQIVAKNVAQLHCIDFYKPHIESCVRRFSGKSVNMIFSHADVLHGVGEAKFDAAFALDVLEHIAPADEDAFMQSLCRALKPGSLVVLGMPSIESQQYASERSRAGHVNCKTGTDLKRFVSKYCPTVLIFSMNDEVVHTGYFAMAHYLIAVGTVP